LLVSVLFPARSHKLTPEPNHLISESFLFSVTSYFPEFSPKLVYTSVFHRPMQTAASYSEIKAESYLKKSLK